MQKLLCRPVVLEQEQTQCVNKIGPNFQNFCGWFALPQAWDVSIVTNHMEAQMTGVISTVSPSAQIQLSGIQKYLQYKNMCNKRVDVTCYRLKCRRDMPAAFVDFFGTNPTWLQTAFNVSDISLPITQARAATAGLPATIVPRTPAFNEHNVELRNSPTLKEFFSIKQVSRVFLAPGEWRKMHFSKKGKKISKVRDGIVAAASWGSTWDHLKWMGPILLFRVQGSNVHDETLYSGQQAAGLTNFELNTTMSGFNVEFYIKTRSKSLNMLSNSENIQYMGTVSNALPTVALHANEQGWEIRAPQEDAMAA